MNAKYREPLDPRSSFEILGERMKQLPEEKPKKSPANRKEKSTFDEVMGSPVAKQVGREIE